MTSNNHDFDAVLTELRQQGLEVTVCSALKETWYIKGSGIHIWYIATGGIVAIKARKQTEPSRY